MRLLFYLWKDAMFFFRSFFEWSVNVCQPVTSQPVTSQVDGESENVNKFYFPIRNVFSRDSSAWTFYVGVALC